MAGGRVGGARSCSAAAIAPTRDRTVPSSGCFSCIDRAVQPMERGQRWALNLGPEHWPWVTILLLSQNRAQWPGRSKARPAAAMG